MALSYAQKTFELREIALKQKPADFLRYSSDGTVPILLLSNDRVIQESLDIVQWALPDENLNLISSFHPQFIKAFHKTKTNDYSDLTLMIEPLKELSLTLESPLARITFFPFVKLIERNAPTWLTETFPHFIKWIETIENDPSLTPALTRFKIHEEGMHPLIIHQHIPSLAEQIKIKLQTHLSTPSINIIDESHLHGYCHGLESHLKVELPLELFAGLSPVERHRKINTILREEVQKLHAFSIHFSK